MDLKKLDFRAQDSAEKLDRLILESGHKLSEIAADLQTHRFKGEAVAVLEKLAEATARLDVLEVMVRAFPDSRRSVVALVAALGRQTEWDAFDKLWRLHREFAGQRRVWLTEIHGLLEEALSQPALVLPLRHRMPEKASPAGLKGVLSAWFGGAKAAPQPGRDRAEFENTYLHPVMAEMEKLGANAGAPVRTRQQRIDDLMAGGKLTDELFTLVSSREDGYANLQRLVELRSEALADLRDPRFGLDLTAEQALELWQLLPEPARAGFGPRLVGAAATHFSTDDLLVFCQAASPKVVTAALGVLLQRFPQDPLRADRTWSQQLVSAHPALAEELREFFIQAVPPASKEFPLWSYSEPGAGRAGLAYGSDHLVFSCPGCVCGIRAGSGEPLFVHHGDDLPVVQFVVDLGLYIGQRQDTICLLRVDPQDYYLLPFHSPIRLQPHDKLASKGRQYMLTRSHGDSESTFILDTPTATVSPGEVEPERKLNDHAAVADDWSTQEEPVHSVADNVRVFMDRKDRGFHAFPSPPGRATLFTCYSAEMLYGLEVHAEGHSVHCWRRSNLSRPDR